MLLGDADRHRGRACRQTSDDGPDQDAWAATRPGVIPAHGVRAGLSGSGAEVIINQPGGSGLGNSSVRIRSTR